MSSAKTHQQEDIMADSQNTYQNDVSISSNSSSKIIKSIVGVAAAAVIGFFGYNFHTTEIENSYNEGYTKGKEFGKESGYSIGYGEGYTEGYDIGYDIASEKADSNSYDKGYNAGYDKGYNTGYNVGYDKGKSSSYSNNPIISSLDNLLINLVSVLSILSINSFLRCWRS